MIQDKSCACFHVECTSNCEIAYLGFDERVACPRDQPEELFSMLDRFMGGWSRLRLSNLDAGWNFGEAQLSRILFLRRSGILGRRAAPRRRCVEKDQEIPHVVFHQPGPRTSEPLSALIHIRPMTPKRRSQRDRGQGSAATAERGT